MVTTRRLTTDYGISKSSAHRILTEDLKLYAYKIKIEPKLTDGAKPHIHHLTHKWCRDKFPSFIHKDHWPPNSPYLNPLDYCIWDEFAQHVNWEKLTSKPTLIDELKRAVKQIRQDVVLQSCSSWTVRLQRVLKNNECYLKK
ncbi:unnamed protein product [Rotaria magnacalcarata]